MRLISSFISGLVFGLGLGLSGMMNPKKVQNFLDIFGDFDGSLIFVMLGALVVSMVVFSLQKYKLKRPIFEDSFCLPTKNKLDYSLIIGSALFGIGWGLAGICPGPSLANLASFTAPTFLLAFGVVLGIGIVGILKKS